MKESRAFASEKKQNSFSFKKVPDLGLAPKSDSSHLSRFKPVEKAEKELKYPIKQIEEIPKASSPPHPDLYSGSDKLLITGDDVLIEYV